MAHRVTILRLATAAGAAALSACATTGESPNEDPEIIGSYATEAECRRAVEAWMSRQVVGNPVSGDCLPIDRH